MITSEFLLQFRLLDAYGMCAGIWVVAEVTVSLVCGQNSVKWGLTCLNPSTKSLRIHSESHE